MAMPKPARSTIRWRPWEDEVFLTKMPLNPRRRGTGKLLGSPQAMHAAVLAGVADARPPGEGRLLCRPDSGQHPLVPDTASPVEADVTHPSPSSGATSTQTIDIAR